MAMRRQRFALRRKAVGLSQEQLAERLGVDRSTVARWESGETLPQPWLRPRIARALQVSADQLDDLLGDERTADQEITSRFGYVMASPASVDLVTVACLRAQVAQLDTHYDQMPSASLLPEAGQCLGQVSFFTGHTRGGRVRQALRLAEAEAATLMGQLVWDASQRRDQSTAIACLDRAISAASQAGDRAAEGRALLRKSFVALYGQKDPHAGLTLASQTVRTAAATSHVLTGLAVLHTAEAHAMLADVHACEQQIALAETSFSQVTDDDPAIELFSQSQLGRMTGSCYLFLGDAKKAEPVLQATAIAAAGRPKSQAIVYGNLALALIRQNRIDEATAALAQAIDIVEINRGGGGLTVIFGAARELRPWQDLPAVRDTYDRLLTLMTFA
jgi:transcriptional regulator with XRE-family HTH domain